MINANNNFSKLFNFGVLQETVLGPYFFNIFINDIFAFIQEACGCNFAVDDSLN